MENPCDLRGPAWCLADVFDDGPALFAAVVQQGLKGVVAKRWSGTYRPGERDWLKMKVGSTGGSARSGSWRTVDGARARSSEEPPAPRSRSCFLTERSRSCFLPNSLHRERLAAPFGAFPMPVDLARDRERRVAQMTRQPGDLPPALEGALREDVSKRVERPLLSEFIADLIEAIHAVGSTR
jgi:hypothetical protein